MTTETEARTVFSDSYQQALNENWSDTYKLGAVGNGSQIDCSHFARKAMVKAFGNLGLSTGGALDSCSEDQLKAIARGTGHCMQGGLKSFEDGGGQAGEIKPGMILALRSGKNHDFAKNREIGIDHIACVYEDSQTHALMVAESTSSRDDEKGATGVQRTELSKWLHKHENHGLASLYVADPVEVATGQSYPSGSALARTGLSAAPLGDVKGGSTVDKFNDTALTFAVFGMLAQMMAGAMKGETSSPAAQALQPTTRPFQPAASLVPQ